MPTFKNFDTDRPEKKERPTFQIAGQTFTCRANLSFRKFRSLAESLDENGGMLQMNQVFSTVLLPGDRERFLELINKDEDDDDLDEIVTIDEVAAIAQWIMEHYTGNGSGQSSSSSAG